MDPQTPAYKLGRITGDVGVTIKGVGEVVLGGSGEIAGTCLDATGVGSVAGIPINIASAAVAADGAVSITGGAKGLLNDAVSLFEGNSSTSSANNTVQNANKEPGKAVESAGSEIKFGSDTKSAKKLSSQMSQRGWTESTVKDTVSNPYTTRVSTNKATGNSATVYYNKSGGYIIIDDTTKAVVQVSDNLNPSTWIPDPSIINPYKP